MREDALGLLYRLEEHGITDPASRFALRLRSALGIGAFTSRLALATLRRDPIRG